MIAAAILVAWFGFVVVTLRAMRIATRDTPWR